MNRYSGATRKAPAGRALPAGMALLLALLLGACTVAEVQPGEALRPSDSEGLVILSLTRSGWRDFDLLLALKGPDEWIGRVIELRAQSRLRDWNGDSDWKSTRPDAPEGRVVVLRLAPGTYRITRWDGSSGRDGLQGNGYILYSGSGLQMTLTVAAGQVIYAGNINLVLPAQPNFGGVFNTGTYTIEAKDQRERDSAILGVRFPDVDPGAVRNALLNFPQSGQTLRYVLINSMDSGGEPPDP